MITTISPCPHCGEDVVIEARTFQPTPPIHEESEMEATKICKCQKGAVHAVIAFTKNSGAVAVWHIRVVPELL